MSILRGISKNLLLFWYDIRNYYMIRTFIWCPNSVNSGTWLRCENMKSCHIRFSDWLAGKIRISQGNLCLDMFVRCYMYAINWYNTSKSSPPKRYRRYGLWVLARKYHWHFGFIVAWGLILIYTWTFKALGCLMTRQIWFALKITSVKVASHSKYQLSR